MSKYKSKDAQLDREDQMDIKTNINRLERAPAGRGDLERISLQLQQALGMRLDWAATKTGTSKSEVVRCALHEFVSKLEAQEMALAHRQALESLAAGQAHLNQVVFALCEVINKDRNQCDGKDQEKFDNYIDEYRKLAEATAASAEELRILGGVPKERFRELLDHERETMGPSLQNTMIIM